VEYNVVNAMDVDDFESWLEDDSALGLDLSNASGGGAGAVTLSNSEMASMGAALGMDDFADIFGDDDDTATTTTATATTTTTTGSTTDVAAPKEGTAAASNDDNFSILSAGSSSEEEPISDDECPDTPDVPGRADPAQEDQRTNTTAEPSNSAAATVADTVSEPRGDDSISGNSQEAAVSQESAPVNESAAESKVDVPTAETVNTGIADKKNNSDNESEGQHPAGDGGGDADAAKKSGHDDVESDSDDEEIVLLDTAPSKVGAGGSASATKSKKATAEILNWLGEDSDDNGSWTSSLPTLLQHTSQVTNVLHR